MKLLDGWNSHFKTKAMENYLEINKKSWNAKVEPHLKSDFTL